MKQIIKTTVFVFIALAFVCVALALLPGCKTNPNNWIEQGGNPYIWLWQDSDTYGK